MEPAPVAEFDPWNLDRLRLPAARSPTACDSTRPPRHRRGEPFLKGPIPYPWISAGMPVARLRPPCRDGNPVPLRSLPGREPLGPGKARRWRRPLEEGDSPCPSRGRGSRVTRRLARARLQAVGFRPASAQPRTRCNSPATPGADTLGLVAHGLAAPWHVPPRGNRVLAPGGMGERQTLRAGLGFLVRPRPLPIRRLSGA